LKRAIAAFCLTGLAGLASAGPAKPTVVSLDYCADQFVLALADRDQILAVSKDAERKFSNLRDSAVGLPKVRAAAEDVIALHPDLVVRSWGGDARALSLYERFGIRTVQIGYGEDMESAMNVTRAVAAEIGQSARADALIAASPPPRPASGLSALYVTPGGVSAGQGTLIAAIMHHAGLANANTGTGWTSLPLEALVQSPPGLMLTAFFGFDDDATDRWSVSRHPVMQRLAREARVVAMDESRVSCPAWLVADEADAIARALEANP
jgi:iron complex transport system substrate-binding protein